MVNYLQIGEIYCTNLIERGDAHPRVTGCEASYKGFHELESARKYMTDKGFGKCREVIKDTAVDTTPKRKSTAYYAVAHGAMPGIKQFW
jgi:viroplasmin and RNaseH domain-containing protein